MKTKKPNIFLPPYKVEHVLGTLSQSQGWHISQLNVPETWQHTEGENIKVMVIDTGCPDHSDLIDGIDKDLSRSFLSFEPEITDFNGHQTHVAGIIGARNNAFGIVGVAPKCTLISCKVLGKDGSGDFGALKAALKYAKKIKPHVINMSLGSHVYSSSVHSLIKDLYKMNIPIIAAAGNDGRRNAVNYPAKYPETIAVSAYDKYGKPARFNSTGPEVDFSAPGVQIYSTWLNNSYAKLNGTSMATPVITGIVALLISKHLKQELETGKNDCQTVEQIKQHLIKYTDDKGILGKDNVWGYGVIDVERVINNSSDNITTTVPALPTQPKNIFQKILSWIKKYFSKN
jgi:subtilisin family serine protease